MNEQRVTSAGRDNNWLVFDGPKKECQIYRASSFTVQSPAEGKCRKHT
jgi:hypothetical protein